MITAGLLVINDTSFAHSAPQLSKESFDSIQAHVQARLLHDGSMTLVQMDSSSASDSPVQLDSLLQMARDQHLAYLVLAVVSSTEIETPERLPLGGFFNRGGMQGFLNGFRAENFALAELVLLDVGTGQALLQSDGQAWASLERLAVPLESNVYPVVRRDLEIPPIYPTSEENAHDVLRAVASSEAIDQAVMHFSESWKKARG